MTTFNKVVAPILPSSRIDGVRYAIRDLSVLADQVVKQGKKVLRLNIGDPARFDFPTPPHMIAAVEKAMRDGKNGYANSLGIPEALDAIRDEAERNGISNIMEIFITSGVSEAVDICFTVLLDVGQNVLCPSPEYPLYTAVVAKAGLTTNSYRLDEAHGWAPDLDDIRRRVNDGTRGLVLINPNNPTGVVYSRRTLEGIADIAREHNLVVFADESYSKLVLDGEHIPFASLAPDVAVITLGGLSKNYLAPGWRIGWGVASGPEAIVKPYVEGINKLLRSRLCANQPMMYAIKPALEGPQEHLADACAKLRRRRDVTMHWAESTPRVSCVRPDGGFYAFPRIDIPGSDEEFVKQLLQEKGVLVVHGSGFGQDPGTRHFRIVFLPNEATLTTAYASISEFMQERYP
jgi:alanine-synthesizing transaminase